jgi:hypothetical protein
LVNTIFVVINSLRSHWVMVVMDVFTRRIIGFGVERADPCGASIKHGDCGA